LVPRLAEAGDDLCDELRDEIADHIS
jgi:hypothetical protein